MVPEVFIVPEVPMVRGVPMVPGVACLLSSIPGPMIPFHSLIVYLKTQFFLLQYLHSHYLLGHMLN